MEADSPSVSAVIPAYNAEEFIGDAIESILEQTYSVHEIIVVDDGSRDDTAGLVERCFGGNVQLIKQRNSGVSAARNTGMMEAEGDLVAFLDADDVWLADKIRVQVEALKTFPDCGVCYTDVRIDTGGTRGLSYPVFEDHRWTYGDVFETQASLPGNEDDGRVDIYAGDLYAALLYNGMILPSSAVLRKELIVAHGLRWDEELRSANDSVFFLQAARNTQFAFVDAPLMQYRSVNPGERLSEHNIGRIETFISAIRRDAELTGYIEKDRAWVEHCLAASHRKLGYHLITHLDLGAARAALRKAMEYEPRSLRTYLLLGVALLPQFVVKLMGRIKRRGGRGG